MFEAIVDEFYTFDSMEIYVKNLIVPSIFKLFFLLYLEFSKFFFYLRYILLIAKVKLSQETIGRNLIVLLKNGKKHCVLTATL